MSYYHDFEIASHMQSPSAKLYKFFIKNITFLRKLYNNKSYFMKAIKQLKGQMYIFIHMREIHRRQLFVCNTLIQLVSRNTMWYRLRCSASK